MESIDRIPTSKLHRASKIVSTGAKLGVNYIKYYGQKISKTQAKAKENLNKNNAEDIYGGLKQLKGSALKVAQMLSMEKNLLPRAYVEKFSLAQFSVPPLSPPLVVKTFKKYFGQTPEVIFDEFDTKSVNAASIGQVHKAKKNGKRLAVKIQYPGVADSIKSDLALIKPFALKILNINAKGAEKYFKEIEEKLTEETDYCLEIEQSQQIADACSHIPNLLFPSYYREMSSNRILTMDFMKGLHLSEFVKTNADTEKSNQLGQALWDFYMHQIHNLKKVHADPHPGNFLINNNAQLIALDFGCMKSIPDTFYIPYFELAEKSVMDNPKLFTKKLYELEILTAEDTPEETAFFKDMFYELLSVFTLPFQKAVFDFSNSDFFTKIGDLAERYSQNTELRKFNNSRGSKHFIYMNRTFFGLYNLMFDLKANAVEINQFKRYK
ncbi:MAG: AarF/UbiB family protein [Bacteroidota bacterium]|nr:AarF/UbiB family protein [Bacteroidota bacterium]